jgi:hypothetical protein
LVPISPLLLPLLLGCQSFALRSTQREGTSACLAALKQHMSEQACAGVTSLSVLLLVFLLRVVLLPCSAEAAHVEVSRCRCHGRQPLRLEALDLLYFTAFAPACLYCCWFSCCVPAALQR